MRVENTMLERFRILTHSGNGYSITISNIFQGRETMKDTREFGNKLIALRGIKTLREVADSVDITEESLSAYERGERVPRDSVKIRLALYYSVKTEDIFD